MKSLATRLAVALVTFTAGVCLTSLTFRRHAPRAAAVTYTVTYMVDAPPQVGCSKIPTPSGPAAGSKGKSYETPEEKAVRLAEEFVARNGYTDLPPDRANLTGESIEWSSDVDMLLRLRRDSLERRAYGVRPVGKVGRPGWTVVFRHKEHDAPDNTGRAVTMDSDFRNLRVQHQDFFLAAVEKKL